MKKFRPYLNRRHLIRSSLGTAASASMLSSFAGHALAANRPRDTNIKRLIIWYVPEGAAQQAFWPAQIGDLMINQDASIDGKHPQSNGGSIRGYIDPSQATYCLQPLHKHTGNISLYSGFKNNGDSSSDPHAKVINTALTGGGDDQRGGSLDQLMAPRLQGSSPFPSIYLPVYGHHTLDKGANSTYMSPGRRIHGGALSGNSNWNPVETYNTLFPDGIEPANGNNNETARRRLAILKSVEARLQQVKCDGGEAARLKLEAMLEAYQKIEQDTQKLIDANNENTADIDVDLPEGWTDTEGSRRDLTKYWNQSANFGQLVDIAIDTTVAAFALDKTRVSLMQFSSSGNNNRGPVDGDHYQTLGIQGLEGKITYDHYLGHNTDPIRRRDQARIFRWYYGRLAYLIDRLKSIPDGDGTLFDTTLIMTASEFSMYNARTNDMPYIVAAGSGINIRKGQYQNVSQQNNFRHHGDFLLGVAQALDPSVPHVGESRTAFKL